MLETSSFPTCEMDSEKNRICPITSKECDPECAWIIKTTSMDGDGVEEFLQCALIFQSGVMTEILYRLDECGN